MSDTSDQSRAAEIRGALARLRLDLEAAGVDLSDPKARQLVIASLGAAGGDKKMGAAQKAALVIEMKASGHGFDEIARVVGYANRGGAYKAYQRALRDVRSSLREVEEVRDLELLRLEELHRGSWADAVKGDHHAVRNVLAAMDRRRHLIPGLEVIHEEAGTAAGGSITVVIAIPEARRVAAIPQEQLGPMIEAHAREKERKRLELEAADPIDA